jgi:hypothetical protein
MHILDTLKMGHQRPDLVIINFTFYTVFTLKKT